MARRRPTEGSVSVADESYARDRLLHLRWDYLAVLDSDAPLTPAQAVVVDRSAAIQAEHKRLMVADLTNVERLALFEAFLDGRGWL